MLTIEFATIDYAQSIMVFIDEHWKKGHVLSKDKELFLYEYQDLGRLNFVIARDKQNHIYGVLGFIQSSNKTKDIWLALWKAIKYDGHAMLGIELLTFLRESQKFNALTCLGINDSAMAIYKYLGFHIGHLHICNKIVTKPNFCIDTEYSLEKIDQHNVDFDFGGKTHFPHKDKDYFIRRYFNHPTYVYNVYGVFKSGSMQSLVVAREVEVGRSRILRIMDYFGDEVDMVFISKDLYELVVDNEYEYIDFMCFGFSEEVLFKSGFKKIDSKSNDIVAPNYFSPFVQENIRVNFMSSAKDIANLKIFKADGDQDRPS
jgi:hypothetical protein